MLVPARALADADPASDVLLGSPVFYPYQPTVSTPLQEQLQSDLAQLAHEGLGLKVAIIGSPVDLGAIPVLFGKPQTYANFLDREISFYRPQPLLVVMPQGVGTENAGPRGALAGLKVNATDGSNGLTRSAIAAVLRIARAVGKPISSNPAGPPTHPSSSGESSSSAIGFGVLAALLILGAALAIVLRRRAVRAAQQRATRRQSRSPSRPGRSGKDR